MRFRRRCACVAGNAARRRYGRISTMVPAFTNRHTASISSFETAMPLSVRSRRGMSAAGRPLVPGVPWMQMSPPGSTPAARAALRSLSSGWEIFSDRGNGERGVFAPIV
jgi:hypothetical protein